MVRVLIERCIAEGLNEEFRTSLRNMRLQATSREGYISGESLHDHDDPNHYVVISNWNSIDAWYAWEASDARHNVMAIIGPMLQEPEKITILEPV